MGIVSTRSPTNGSEGSDGNAQMRSLVVSSRPSFTQTTIRLLLPKQQSKRPKELEGIVNPSDLHFKKRNGEDEVQPCGRLSRGCSASGFHSTISMALTLVSLTAGTYEQVGWLLLHFVPPLTHTHAPNFSGTRKLQTIKAIPSKVAALGSMELLALLDMGSPRAALLHRRRAWRW